MTTDKTKIHFTWLVVACVAAFVSGEIALMVVAHKQITQKEICIPTGQHKPIYSNDLNPFYSVGTEPRYQPFIP